jgi:sugar/nucleoside kinase (ribokinase family)
MVEALCIGHASFDLSVFLPGFPGENTKTETGQLLEAGGGPAANAAYLLSSWGVRCAFAGVVGDDTYGSRALDEFRAVGTDLSLTQIRTNDATPVSLILVNLKNGSRTLVNRKAAGAPLRIGKATLTALGPRFLLFDGHETKASLGALQALPDAISVLDAGSWREGTAVLAGKVDYLVASEKFALQACKMPSLENARAWRACIEFLRGRYGNHVVVTLGEHGAIAGDERGYYRVRACKSKPVDTTAAGDIFHGAFVYGLRQGMDFREILRFASMAGGLSVSRRGGRPSIPTLREVKTALANVN